MENPKKSWRAGGSPIPAINGTILGYLILRNWNIGDLDGFSYKKWGMGRQVGKKAVPICLRFPVPQVGCLRMTYASTCLHVRGKILFRQTHISYYCIHMCYYISIIPRYIPIIYNSPYLKFLMCAGRCLWSHHDGEQKVGREAAGLGRTGWVVSWHWQRWKVYFFPRNTHQDFSYTNAGKPCKARNCNKISVSLTRPGIEKSCATFKIVNVNRKHMV